MSKLMSTIHLEVDMGFRAKKGEAVEVTRGGKEGLTGTVVGSSWRSGGRKIKLDDGATVRGSSVVTVNKKKLKRQGK